MRSSAQIHPAKRARDFGNFTRSFYAREKYQNLRFFASRCKSVKKQKARQTCV